MSGRVGVSEAARVSSGAVMARKAHSRERSPWTWTLVRARSLTPHFSTFLPVKEHGDGTWLSRGHDVFMT